MTDFYSGHNYSTPARKTVWDLLATRFGGWECTANRYEKFGSGGLACRGIKDILMDLINPESLEEYAFTKYGHRKDWTLDEKKRLVLKTLGGTLSNQFRNKFTCIYSMYNGSKVFPQEEFKELDKMFNMTPSTNTAISKAKLLPIAAKVNELLEPLSKEEKDYVLGV